MDPLKYFLLYISPYITVVIFLSGLLYRLYKWITATNGPLAPIYPSASKPFLEKISEYLVKVATFRPLFEVNKKLWFSSWIFHLGLFLLLFGHFRLVTEFTFLWSILGISTKEGIANFALISGGLAGLMFMLPQLYLLYRRFTPILRKLSVFEDYFAISLMLALALTGNYMRFFEHIDVEVYREYFLGLLTFNFVSLDPSPAFLAHYVLAQLMLVYFPFGKLFHTLGAFVTNAVPMINPKR